MDSSDILRLIGSCGLEVTLRMALVCKEWREAIDDGHSTFYTAWRALSSIEETSLMRDLVSALRLSPARVKEGEHRKKRRFGGGAYNIFTHSSAVKLFHANGGFDGLQTRLEKYERRVNNKKSRCSPSVCVHEKQ